MGNAIGRYSPDTPLFTEKFAIRYTAIFLTLIAILFGSLLAIPAAHAEGEARDNQAIALKVVAVLDKASDAAKKGDFQSAYRLVQASYFDYYDPLLEGPSRILAGGRKVKMESLYGDAKRAAKEEDAAAFQGAVAQLRVGVVRDAMILDGVLDDEADESTKIAAAQKVLKDGQTLTVDQGSRESFSFITAFTILLREGLEALLVVAAIVLYLVRSGNKHLNKYVYAGVGAGVVLSLVLSVVFTKLVENAGAAQEMLEGITMFIAVFVLFYISNWMLSKSDGAAWQKFVQEKVDRSISQQKTWLLAFAAFLAVAREGAELVLFYVAAFSGDRSDPLWVIYGIVAAVAVLAVIFVIFRFYAVKLPIGLVFKGTSLLLFMLAITFVGNGVGELGEAGFIVGQTDIPSLHWLTFPELGIYPKAETLLPQLILIIAAVWLGLAHRKSLAEKKREAEKVAA
ncbi:FTR1 family iron permease [Dermabacteraceae bacterium CCM 9520]